MLAEQRCRLTSVVAASLWIVSEHVSAATFPRKRDSELIDDQIPGVTQLLTLFDAISGGRLHAGLSRYPNRDAPGEGDSKPSAEQSETSPLRSLAVQLPIWQREPGSFPRRESRVVGRAPGVGCTNLPRPERRLGAGDGCRWGGELDCDGRRRPLEPRALREDRDHQPQAVSRTICLSCRV